MRTKILIVGDRDLTKKAHAGIEASFERSTISTALCFEWLSTNEVDSSSLANAAAVWCAPGSPYKSTSGAIAAIRRARTTGIPFLGTCGGFQHALLEFASNVLGIDAKHQELDPEAPNPLITRLSCPLIGARSQIFSNRGSRFTEIIGSESSEVEFNCNFGINQDLEGVFRDSEIEFVAWDADRQPRVFWHRHHPFFVGTLFQPERSALAGATHPLIEAFFRQAIAKQP